MQINSVQTPSITIDERVETLLQQMTLAEKIGQMTQVEKNSITPEQIKAYHIGSLLSGGGGNPTPNTPRNWALMVRQFQEAALEDRLAIPLIYGSDAVHGHSNVHGAVIFPHNIGLGATRDPNLVERVAAVTATEILATGVHWDFAPAVSIPHDVRWGRTFEGFSEDTALVSEMGAAFVRGLQHPNQIDPQFPRKALASVKHFIADGGTNWEAKNNYYWSPIFGFPKDEVRYGIDQGNATMDEATLRAVHLPPYIAAIEAGALNIMISYSAWNGLKMHEHRYLITDVLKGELGFEGFLVSDWHAINQLQEDFYVCVCNAINAGIDMNMVPWDFKQYIELLTTAVQRGDVPMSRIDDAVRRILRVKMQIGMFENPLCEIAWADQIGSVAHRAVAREAVRKSLVLLKNDNQTLPIHLATETIIVAGESADNIGYQCGGWTIEWMGTTKKDATIGATSLKGISERGWKDETVVHYDPEGTFPENDFKNEKADIGIVFIAEEPYVEGKGDTPDIHLKAEQIALIERVRPQCKKLVLVMIAGRPLIITDQVPLCDAIVMAWLPGSEADAMADVLFGDYPFSGKLPVSYPRNMDQVPLRALKAHAEPPLFPFGFGLTTNPR